MFNSLNIHFKGIHALGNLFSLTFYEKRDQNEISTIILNYKYYIQTFKNRFFQCA